MTRLSEAKARQDELAEALRLEFESLAQVHLSHGWREGASFAKALAADMGVRTRQWLAGAMLKRAARQAEAVDPEMGALIATYESLAGRAPAINMAAFYAGLLIGEIGDWLPPDAAEQRPAKRRQAWSGKVESLALDLAKALSQPDAPAVPRALELFDVDLLGAAANRIGALVRVADQDRPGIPPGLRRAWVSGVGESKTLKYPGELEPLLQQDLVKLLYSLASWASKPGAAPGRDARPNTGDADARTFARHLSGWFDRTFAEVPHAVIADLLPLRCTGPAPSAKVVRDWLTS